LSEIEWITINPGSTWLGDNRGALMHAANGPRHEIQIKSKFEISSEPITFAQWKTLTGQAVAGKNSNSPVNRLTPLMIEAGLVGVTGDPRPPSEAEWALAAEQGAISPGEVQVEVLSDRPPRSGYWGAPCDGRPWTPLIRAGGISDHTAHTTRVWKDSDTMRGATPRGVSRPQMGFRLVRIFNSTKELNMPKVPPKKELIIRESIMTFFIGILPSFTWAYFNASPGYISDSWLNIAVGGIFFSIMSAFLWRPKTPSYSIQDGKLKRD